MEQLTKQTNKVASRGQISSLGSLCEIIQASAKETRVTCRLCGEKFPLYEILIDKKGAVCQSCADLNEQ